MAGQQHSPGEHEVALALVDLPRDPDPRITAVAEPLQVRAGLPGPLRMPEPHPEHRPAHHRRPVGREHHVGQSGQRLDDPHRRIAVAASVGSPGRIHGLIAYVTAKCSGGHIKYRRGVAVLLAEPPRLIMSPG